MNVAPAGDRALLIDFGAIAAEELHARALRAKSRPEVLACIAGQQSLYVIFRGAADRSIDVSPADVSASEPRRHRIEVSFGREHGRDLEELLARHGVTRDAFLARVASLTLRARYLGFRGGFAYLDGWPAEWAMPRRKTSRAVPRGSFALAAAVAGFYPIDSPGGWNLLGRTDALPEFRIGDEVTIMPVDRELHVPPPPVEPKQTIEALEILSGGQFTTIVGEADWSRIDRGLSAGGPFDDVAANAANRAVGNDSGTPVLECALVGPRLRFRRDATFTWRDEVRHVRAGEEIDLGRLQRMREYLAVRWSAGVLTGAARVRTPAIHRETDRRTIRVRRGPHETPLRELTCEVTPQLDRIGIRLRPLDPVPVDVPADLPSCGMQFGTIQLHPDRSLIAMGPDHPITGGYLQPFTVLWEERWKLGQLAPGDRVHFVSEGTSDQV